MIITHLRRLRWTRWKLSIPLRRNQTAKLLTMSQPTRSVLLHPLIPTSQNILTDVKAI
jgi:hypothetical protein